MCSMANSTQEIKAVTIFGHSAGVAGEPTFDAARETAKIIASTGRTIVNGGGPGVMLAATLGAKEGGGKATVVYYNPQHATKFEGKATVNIADKEFKESNYITRTKKLIELGDAYIMFNGGTGTISEFAMCWGVARLYFGHHKPLILYGEFWKNIMLSFEKNMMIRPEEHDVYTIVTTPEEALAAIEQYDKILDNARRNNYTDDEAALFL
jgi:predicted Rossmann-fold nucleotide-binding protein